MGGPVYAPQAYARYTEALGKAKEDLARERSRLFLFRDYGPVRTALQEVLKEGEALRATIEAQKRARASAVEDEIAASRARLAHLRELASMMNEGYRATRNLTRADVALIEAASLYQQGAFDSAQTRLHSAREYLQDAQQLLDPIVTRYSGHAQVTDWRRMVEDTVSASRRSGGLAIVVTKIDRKLTVYRGGTAVRTYPVGLGRAGYSLKRYQGDHATPEGQYAILRKLPASKYYKALLINYPNEEDRQRFRTAKARGGIPRSARIGGLVEIHGGGTDGMTYGCIALDNANMAELFDMVGVGTRVTIVGSTEYRNRLSSAADGS